MRLIGIDTEATSAIRFIFREVPLKPHDLRLIFKCEHVCGDSVEEPAIVTDDDGAARKTQQAVFKGSQGVDIKIIGRFVEKEDIASARKDLCEMYSISLAA